MSSARRSSSCVGPVSRSAIYSILAGKTWSWLTGIKREARAEQGEVEDTQRKLETVNRKIAERLVTATPVRI